jgi:antitoxin component of MazEF toxin-antitoxin module
MKTVIQRWGNSLALRISRAYAAETRGSDVELTLKSGTLVIRLIARKRHLLPDLLKRIIPANRHGPVWSAP